MERAFFELGEETFLLINSPLIVLSLVLNVFYAYCLILNKGKLKKLLYMLLGFLISCSIAFLILMFFTYGMLKNPENLTMTSVYWAVILCIVHSNLTGSTWLSFYFYTQIVPSQRTFLIWVKKNIRCFIYTGFLLDEFIIFLSSALDTTEAILETSRCVGTNNGTWTELREGHLNVASLIAFYLVKLHVLFCLCMMLVSDFSIVHYLHRHMKNVAQRDFSSQTTQGQMRAAVSGFLQGVFFLFYGMIYFIDSIINTLSGHYTMGPMACSTLTSLYISATTVNLGVGQTIFRQEAADIWKTITALCNIAVKV